MVGTHEGEARVWSSPWTDRVVTSAMDGEVRIWDVGSARLERTLESPADARRVALDPRQRLLATGPGNAMPRRSMFLFDLAAPRSAEPAPLLGSEGFCLSDLRFSPGGGWLASVHRGSTILWNLASPRSQVVGRQQPPLVHVAFTRDGHLLSTSNEGVLRRWPLGLSGEMQALWSKADAMIATVLEVDPGGRFVVLVNCFEGEVLVVPLDGLPPTTHRLRHPQGTELATTFASLDPTGRFLAAEVQSPGNVAASSIRVLDLATGEERTLDTHATGEGRCEELGCNGERWVVPIWLRDGTLLSDGAPGLLVWDLATGTSRLLRPCQGDTPDVLLVSSPDSRSVLRLDPADVEGAVSTLTVFDLETLETREITAHGNLVESFALDAAGVTLVTGDRNGVVRVGALAGGEPRLLYGHSGPVMSVAVSPDGRWIASGSEDGTIRRWPMPDLAQPPLHTLPHDELLATLRSLTNLRAVRDPAADSGWKVEVGPFPGWEPVPTWQP